MTRLSLIVIALTFWFTWKLYPSLPPVMMTHWGLSGEVNGWMSRANGAWFVPILLVLIFGLLTTLPHVHGYHYPEETFMGPYQIVGFYLVLFMALIQVLVVSVNLGVPVDMLGIMSWMMVVFMAVLGRLLPETTRNPLMGIRTPWTMGSDRVWRLTHRETGRVLRGSALVSILFLLLLTRPYSFMAVLICFVASMLWGVLYSYFIHVA